MQTREYAIGQAVFVRTDGPDYTETTVGFQSLGELVQICSEPREGMLLDKVVIYASVAEEPRSISMSFLAASKGTRPGNLDPLLVRE